MVSQVAMSWEGPIYLQVHGRPKTWAAIPSVHLVDKLWLKLLFVDLLW
jgi:hypothetical protein